MSNFHISGRQVKGLKLLTSAPLVLSLIISGLDPVTSHLGVLWLRGIT